jgi:hypothetical protein
VLLGHCPDLAQKMSELQFVSVVGCLTADLPLLLLLLVLV